MPTKPKPKNDTPKATTWQAVDKSGRVLGTATSRENLESIFKNYLLQGLVKIEELPRQQGGMPPC